MSEWGETDSNSEWRATIQFDGLVSDGLLLKGESMCVYAIKVSPLRLLRCCGGFGRYVYRSKLKYSMGLYFINNGYLSLGTVINIMKRDILVSILDQSESLLKVESGSGFVMKSLRIGTLLLILV